MNALSFNPLTVVLRCSPKLSRPVARILPVPFDMRYQASPTEQYD